MVFDKKPEILAPAGTLDAVLKVVEAGADAVYVGGKSLNMRQHRSSYNLTESEIGQAIEFTHGRGKRLYFTLNSLVLDSQIAQVRDILAMLNRLGPDAIIVQDLAVASLAREICVQIPLHASTMMNVHNVETAIALKMIGFTRIIPSRDIPLHEIRRIGEQSGLQMECFVHGDICISQSSQCYLSGILFGQSANCGRCMKPCRWKWKLVAKQTNAELPGVASAKRGYAQAEPGRTEGYLLARKDMCLFQHIPALVQNGIAALKIEGRMRTAEFLVPVVAMYRSAVDRYFEDPVSYATNAADMRRLFAQRVRELTTAHTFSNPGYEGVDISGKREPRFFSHASPAPELTVGNLPEQAGNPDVQPAERNLELIVHVSSLKGAEAAVEAGADAIYFCGEGFYLHGGIPTMEQLADFVQQVSQSRTRIGVMMPHVCDERDMSEWGQRLRPLAELENITIGVSNLGGLQLARDGRFGDILADYPLNITNSVAADELSTMGAARITASVELTFRQLVQLTGAVRMPVEVAGQGPICGMLLEHCVPAAAAGENPQGVCSMRCRLGAYAMEDATSQVYPLECDRRCRNHLFTATDVCVLPNLSRMVSLGISGLRIEGQLDKAQTIGLIARIYRESIDRLRAGLPARRKAGEPIDVTEALSQISAATGRPLSDGPFDFRSISPAHKPACHRSGREEKFART
jgi:putative protease